MFAGALAQVDECPALFQVHGRGHFDGHVLVMGQGIHSHGEMVVPVGRDVHQVDVLPATQFFVAFFACIYGRFGHVGVCQVFLAGFGAVCFVVT